MSLKLILIPAMLCASAAFAAGLTNYTTQELLSEVGRRVDSLLSGDTGGPLGGGELRFTCDGSRLQVQVISKDGYQSQNVATPSTGDCIRQQTILKNKYDRFRGFVVIDVCDHPYLETLKITDAPKIQTVNSASTAGYQQCLEQISSKES